MGMQLRDSPTPRKKKIPLDWSWCRYSRPIEHSRWTRLFKKRRGILSWL